MTTSNRLWIAVVAILAIAIIALGWFLGVQPKLNEANLSQASTDQVQAQNLQRAAQTAKLKADFENLATISATLAALQAQLPSNSNYPEFLAELNTIAGDHSVSVTNATFDTALLLTGTAGASPAPTASAVPSGSATTPSTAPPAPVSNAAPAGSTVAIPTKLTFTGSFSNLQAAIGALQTGDRLFLVSGLNFKQAGAVGADGAPVASNSYTVDIDGDLYVLTDGSTLVTTTPTATAPTPTTTATP